jgi:hypothetical protein
MLGHLIMPRTRISLAEYLVLPLLCPYFAPSDFHVCGFLEKHVEGKHLRHDEMKA